MDQPQPGSLPKEIEDVLRQFRTQHLKSPAHNLQLNEEFTKKLMEVCDSVFESPDLSPNLASELRNGFGNAMGVKLVDWVWASLAPSFKPGSGPTTSADLKVKCPPGIRGKVKEMIKSISYDFLEKTGVSLPDAQFEDGPEIVVYFRSQELRAVHPNQLSKMLESDILMSLLTYADRFLTAQQIKQKLLNLWGQKPELLEMYDEERVGLAATARVLRHLLRCGYPIWEFDLIMESIITNYRLSTVEEFAVDVERDMSEVLRTKNFRKPTSNGEQDDGPPSSLADMVRIELGNAAVSLADPSKSESLNERIKSIRIALAYDLGWTVPGIRISCNPKLKPEEFRIYLRERVVAGGFVWQEFLMAMGPPDKLEQLGGVRSVDPAFKSPVVWIRSGDRSEAETIGSMVFTPLSVLSMSLTKSLRENASDLITLQTVQDSLEELRESSPCLVKIVESTPELMLKARDVFSDLLSEEVPILDKARILEMLCRKDNRKLPGYLLTEMARDEIPHLICRDLLTIDGVLPVLRLSEQLEEICSSAWVESPSGPFLDLTPEQQRVLSEHLCREVEAQNEQGVYPVLIVRPSLRRSLQRVSRSFLPELSVLTESQIAPTAEVLDLGTVEAPFDPRRSRRIHRIPGTQRPPQRLKKLRKHR